MIDVEFEFEIWRPNLRQVLFGNRNSYFNTLTETIYIYHHGKRIGEEAAFRTVVYDVEHESFHAILNTFISSETSRVYDNIAEKLELWFIDELKDILEIFRKAQESIDKNVEMR